MSGPSVEAIEAALSAPYASTPAQAVVAGVDAAYPFIRADVIAEVVDLLRAFGLSDINRQCDTGGAVDHTLKTHVDRAADFIERECGR